jgi:8-amino-3,8-dideoxy-alpha-D-manno-octulosonate transaminase
MPGFEIFGEDERREVEDVLKTGVLFRYGFEKARNGHFKALTFEKNLGKAIGAEYCHLCSSGTAALSIALAACGIGAGDEVIVPPFTFIATIEAVLNAGAVPVFTEIDETLCMDPDGIENVLSPRTKAVLPVHMCGAMARIDEIKDFCDRKGLTLMEDACQSLGATFNGRALGTFGRMGCFSFDYVKTITCGEGGAVVTNDHKLYLLADQYSDHGHDHIGSDRGLEGHPVLGANYRISELNAAVGVAQLKKLDTILATQRRNKSILKEAMSGFSDVSFRTLPDESGDSATFLSFFLPNEGKTRNVLEALGREGVDGCFYWYANNWHYHRQWEHLKKMKAAARLPAEILETFSGYDKMEFPRSDGVMKKTISMQIKLSWSDEQIQERIEKIQNVLKG